MTSNLAHQTDPMVEALDHHTAARLQRLTERVRVTGLGHRRLSEQDARALATALLRDIDETILPRHVRVTTNTGRTVLLDIAGRRLLRLEIPGSGGAVGQPDDPLEAAQLISAELKRALANATELTLQTQRVDSAQDRSDVGCSAASLADAMGLDLDALEGESLTDKALRAVSRHAGAVLVLDGHGRCTRRIGDDGMTSDLETLARDHLREITATMVQAMGRGHGRGCLCLGVHPDSGAHLICTLQDKSRILAWVDARATPALLPLLQDIFAR